MKSSLSIIEIGPQNLPEQIYIYVCIYFDVEVDDCIELFCYDYYLIYSYSFIQVDDRYILAIKKTWHIEPENTNISFV